MPISLKAWMAAVMIACSTLTAGSAAAVEGAADREAHASWATVTVGMAVTDLQAQARDLAAQVQVAQAGGDLPRNYAAQVEVRLQALERSLQALTGRIEQLQHRTNQVDSRLDRAIADIEFRLGQLEAASVAAAGEPVTPSPDPVAAPGSAAAPGSPAAPLVPQPARRPTGGTVDPQSRQDGGSGTLGTLTFTAPPDAPGTGTEGAPPAPAASPAPVNAALAAVNPAEAYQSAYRLLQQGDYAAAESALQAFVSTHSDHNLSSNAHYWLGETYFVRGRYDEAAATFARGYQQFPNGPKAVDNLLKLGMALAHLDRRRDACVALTRIGAEFPEGPSAVLRRADSEIDRLGCP